MSDTELQALVNTELQASKQFLILYYRRVLDHLFEGGNIFDTRNTGRLEAYSIIALIASNLRREQ
jgi:hypothetical protein